MALPVVKPDNKEKFVLPEDVINRVDKGLSRSEQPTSLPIIKGVNAEKKLLKEAKSKNKLDLKGMLCCSQHSLRIITSGAYFGSISPLSISIFGVNFYFDA